MCVCVHESEQFQAVFCMHTSLHRVYALFVHMRTLSPSHTFPGINTRWGSRVVTAAT